jgi:hypothetical protein
LSESLNTAERSREFYGAEKAVKLPDFLLFLYRWGWARGEDKGLEEYLREIKII